MYKTDPDDWNVNATDSYLNLSPLYGLSLFINLSHSTSYGLLCPADDASQNQVRDKESGRGLLYPDTFAEDRLMLAPPAVIVLLVIFSRNHNVGSLSRSAIIWNSNPVAVHCGAPSKYKRTKTMDGSAPDGRNS